MSFLQAPTPTPAASRTRAPSTGPVVVDTPNGTVTLLRREDAPRLDVAKPLRTLCEMLTYKRAPRSLSERKFIKRYIRPLPGARADSYGNYVVRIGDSAVMYSCHIDSVHREFGKQRLLIRDATVGIASKKDQCLGADDAAGIWIMREMIYAKKPGLYVFHREEESGGLGSSDIVANNPDLVRGIKAAIAFDRRGKHDVITHQAGGRSASDKFADSVAAQLGHGYKRSANGIFTDTANYTGLIGECTNISVGYDNEHTAQESLDLAHIMKVREAMLAFDESKLEFARQPGEVEPFPRYYTYGDEDEGLYSPERYIGRGSYSWPESDKTQLSGTHGDYMRMARLVRENSYEVADILDELGIDLADLREAILSRGGTVRQSRY